MGSKAKGVRGQLTKQERSLLEGASSEEVLPVEVLDSWRPVRFSSEDRISSGAPFYKAMSKYLDSASLLDLGPTIALMDAVTQRLLTLAEEKDSPDFRNRAVQKVEAYMRLLEAKDVRESGKAPGALLDLHEFLCAGHDEISAQVRACDLAERRSVRAESARRVDIAEQQTITYRHAMQFIADVYSVIRDSCKHEPELGKRIIKTVSAIASQRSGVVVPESESVPVPEDARRAVKMIEQEESFPESKEE